MKQKKILYARLLILFFAIASIIIFAIVDGATDGAVEGLADDFAWSSR
jgi:hypothetical protein